MPPMAATWLLPRLTPTCRQGENTDQNTNVAGRGKTGRELSGAEASARSGLPVAVLDNQGKSPRRV